MGELHQDRWIEFLPLVLLGRRVALQPDIGASPSELALGVNVRIPGDLLQDPGEWPEPSSLKSLLDQVKNNTNRKAVQTSNHSAPERELKAIPDNITHVYTRQHKKVGLSSPFEGPFRIHERLSRSTVKIEVGKFLSGEPRFEVRHINDLKLAHPDSMAAEASRPKLGRPARSDSRTSTDRQSLSPSPTPSNRSNDFPQPPTSQAAGTNKQTFGTRDSVSHATSFPERSSASCPAQGGEIQNSGPPDIAPFSSSGRPIRSTRNANPYYVDAMHCWSATPTELAALNRAINAEP